MRTRQELEQLELSQGPGDQIIIARVERTGEQRVAHALRLSPAMEILNTDKLDLGSAVATKAVAALATETELHLSAALLVSPQGDPSKPGAAQKVDVVSQNFCDATPAPAP